MSESKRPTSQGSGAVGGYFERVTGETREYLAEILEENERLRALAVKREMDSRAAAGPVERIAGLDKANRRQRETIAQRNEQVQVLTVEHQEALAEVARVTAELARLQKDVANAEAEHRNFVNRLAAIDKKNTNLTYLHVTSHRLHSTLDRHEILEAITETIVNVVGSEDFAVYELDAARGVLDLAVAVGNFDEGMRSVPVGVGALGEAVARGETLIAGGEDGVFGLPGGKGVAAMIPLRRDRSLVGAIAIFSLLPQKNGTFDEVDIELFELLASEAATALYCARLHHDHAGARFLV